MTGTATVNGTISANGTDGPSGYGVGGSGGSIYLTTATLTGSGSFTANGGSSGSGNTGGGGGGRIAVILSTGTDFGSVSMRAYGGTRGGTGQGGGAGTIYKKTPSQTYGDLIIDNNNQSESVSATTLISSNVTGRTVGDVTIRNAGNLQLNTNLSLTVYGDWTNNATFTADTNSTVSLAGTNEVNISGSSNTTFYNFTSATAGKVIKFEAGKTNTVNGKLTLAGVTLHSTVPGDWWYLNLVNAGETYQDVRGVTVRDSNAGNGQTIIAGPYPFSKDKGHNINWTFLRPAGTVFSIK